MRHAFPGKPSRLYSASRFVAAAIVAVTACLTGQAASAADARSAAVVIDVKTGKVLYSASKDSRRYPASLTKMMTLYITFEALAAGKISKQTKIPFSAQASAKPPTKLGVKAGSSVTAETAIYALVTKSANDAATALGEYFGGTEEGFARMMTAKARKLGMSGTVFRNPSGLPDPGQFTTAHDMARLGMALRRDFPQYYSYFSTRSFTYGRQRMPNHNRLLGRVKGVDGIKTGYTRASGFNLVSSVSDGNRRIVAVVMGGSSGAARDRQMVALIQKYLPQASTKGSALVADAGAAKTNLADIILPKRDTAPLETAETPQEDIEEITEIVAEAPKGKQLQASKNAKAEMDAEALPAPQAVVDEVRTASVAPSAGWAVQVASSPSKTEAQQALAKTSRAAPKLLSAKSGFTTTFEKSGTTYHRARFGGFKSKASANQACTALKRMKIACYAIEN